MPESHEKKSAGQSRASGLLSWERLAWATLLALSVAANILLIPTPARADLDTYHVYQQIFQNVMHHVKTMFVEDVDEKKLLIGAIRGLLNATGDPYTRFLDHDEHQEFNNAEEGRKVGIGVEVTLRGQYPVVIAPVEGGPAHKAGVLSGDVILSIDGKSLHARPFGEILKLISGQIGSVVDLELRRIGYDKPVKIRVVRGIFTLEYVRGTRIADGQIGYIRLLQFFGEDSGSVEKFKNYLLDFKSKNVKGVIIDLRDNPGGHLQMATVLTGYFLDPGSVIVKARGRADNNRTYASSGADAGLLPKRIGVVVLINKGSASASEIMAGALQDHGRAKLIGTRSFGKASVQQIVRPLPDDTAVLVTVQKYYTPLDRSLHGVGLKPDIDLKEIAPDRDETHFLNKLRESNFLEEFRKGRPQYGPETLDAFLKETGDRGWKFSRPLALVMLKRSYNLQKPGILDPETDVQLARAIQELLK